MKKRTLGRTLRSGPVENEEEDIELTPEENDEFWGWLRSSGEIYALRDLLTNIPDDLKRGRNEPCSCGSGKKYKKCCGR